MKLPYVICVLGPICLLMSIAVGMYVREGGVAESPASATESPPQSG